MKYMNGFEKFNEGNFWKDRQERRKKDKMLKKAEIEIKKHLKKFLLKEFEFQYSTYVWTGPHSNYLEIDVADF